MSHAEIANIWIEVLSNGGQAIWEMYNVDVLPAGKWDIRPLKPNDKFQFTINFRNLNSITHDLTGRVQIATLGFDLSQTATVPIPPLGNYMTKSFPTGTGYLTMPSSAIVVIVSVASEAGMMEELSFIMPIATTQPCFIATAAYGTPLAPQLYILRNFRDRCLPSALTNLYYLLSPPMASFIKLHERIRLITKNVLEHLVCFLDKC